MKFYVSGIVLEPAAFTDDKVLQSVELYTVQQQHPPGLEYNLTSCDLFANSSSSKTEPSAPSKKSKQEFQQP